MTKARTIATYKVYTANVVNYAVTYPKIDDEPFTDDWGLITDITFELQEDYGTL